MLLEKLSHQKNKRLGRIKKHHTIFHFKTLFTPYEVFDIFSIFSVFLNFEKNQKLLFYLNRTVDYRNAVSYVIQTYGTTNTKKKVLDYL